MIHQNRTNELQKQRVLDRYYAIALQIEASHPGVDNQEDYLRWRFHALKVLTALIMLSRIFEEELGVLTADVVRNDDLMGYQQLISRAQEISDEYLIHRDFIVASLSVMQRSIIDVRQINNLIRSLVPECVND